MRKKEKELEQSLKYLQGQINDLGGEIRGLKTKLTKLNKNQDSTTNVNSLQGQINDLQDKLRKITKAD